MFPQPIWLWGRATSTLWMYRVFLAFLLLAIIPTEGSTLPPFMLPDMLQEARAGFPNLFYFLVSSAMVSTAVWKYKAHGDSDSCGEGVAGEKAGGSLSLITLLQ